MLRMRKDINVATHPSDPHHQPVYVVGELSNHQAIKKKIEGWEFNPRTRQENEGGQN
ncbi:hypothetical protein [Roseovarius sp. D22-M7]|uniref:hypothetical protein n=1 Tax=Roseovarius sp. D22-M7 TaxID=3127116 RepID=UPI003010101D